MTILALGPTGKFVKETNNLGVEERHPVWRFAITNTGRSDVIFDPHLLVLHQSVYEDRVKMQVVSASSGYYTNWLAALRPRHGVEAEAAVPVDKELSWCGAVDYFPRTTTIESNLWPIGEHVRLLHGLFPSMNVHCDQTDWHSPTNIAPTSVPPQNGTNL